MSPMITLIGCLSSPSTTCRVSLAPYQFTLLSLKRFPLESTMYRPTVDSGTLFRVARLDIVIVDGLSDSAVDPPESRRARLLKEGVVSEVPHPERRIDPRINRAIRK